MAYSIPRDKTTLQEFQVEVSLSSGEEVTYSVFTDSSGGDSPGTIGSTWAVEDEGGSVDSTSVIQVSFNQNLLPDAVVTELLQRHYGPGVSYSDGQVLVDSLDFDFLPSALQSLEADVADGAYESIEEGLKDILPSL